MTTPNHEIFIDTSFLVATLSERDKYHSKAVSLAQTLKTQQVKFVTTRAGLLEVGNSFSKEYLRYFAVQSIIRAETDPDIEVVGLSEALFADAFQLFRNRPDKEWGLVDCISFVVMEQRGMTDALTADEHFVQAGFNALLR